MGDPHVLTGLIAKRAELAGQIAVMQDKLRKLVVDLDHIDAAIRQFSRRGEEEAEALKVAEAASCSGRRIGLRISLAGAVAYSPAKQEGTVVLQRLQDDGWTPQLERRMLTIDAETLSPDPPHGRWSFLQTTSGDVVSAPPYPQLSKTMAA
jgi:hypothetical protein